MQPNARPADLYWKYWAKRADWPQARSYVVTSAGLVVAHAAVIPGAILVPGRRSTTGHVIDWVARRGQVGAGTALMKHIGQQLDSLIAIGGSEETLRILPHIGFRPAGTVVAYVRPLRPAKVLGTAGLGWKTLPRLARNTFWKLVAPRVDPRGWRSRLVASHEFEAVRKALPSPVHGVAVLERNLDLFRYAVQCTIVTTTLHVMEKSSVVGGYFVLAAAPGQVRIVDGWVNSAEIADWSSMVQCAVEQARLNPLAAEVVIWAGAPPLSQAVRACGFRARVVEPVFIRSSVSGSVVPTSIDVRMIDNDAAYFHEEQIALLA
jgi:hypothetical protein